MSNRTSCASKYVGCLLLTAIAMAAVGCQDGHSLSGTVTVDGSPLPTGHIGFVPVGDQGKRAGTQVENGAYSLGGLTPGKYRVYVTGRSGDAPIPQSREEAAQAAANAPKDLVTRDHPQNGQEVEITESTSSLDFEY